jgi:hypothetical protein
MLSSLSTLCRRTRLPGEPSLGALPQMVYCGKPNIIRVLPLIRKVGAKRRLGKAAQ